MLIHTLRPRWRGRVIAIRADSICRLVTYAGSSAWMPYSPKVTRVPPLAAPERFGWCCLRCLTRRGISMGQLSSVVVGSVVVGSAAVASGVTAVSVGSAAGAAGAVVAAAAAEA